MSKLKNLLLKKNQKNKKVRIFKNKSVCFLLFSIIKPSTSIPPHIFRSWLFGSLRFFFCVCLLHLNNQIFLWGEIHFTCSKWFFSTKWPFSVTIIFYFDNNKIHFYNFLYTKNISQTDQTFI